MQQRSLGSSGLRVSLVGLGCNNFGRRIDAEASRKVVHKALDLGVTLFDTADVYRSAIGGSEEFLGQALGRGARTLCRRPRSACRWTPPGTRAEPSAVTSCRRWRRACGG